MFKNQCQDLHYKTPKGLAGIYFHIADNFGDHKWFRWGINLCLSFLVEKLTNIQIILHLVGYCQGSVNWSGLAISIQQRSKNHLQCQFSIKVHPCLLNGITFQAHYLRAMSYPHPDTPGLPHPAHHPQMGVPTILISL